MNVSVMPAEYQEVPINECGELCEPSEVALGMVIHNRSGSLYNAGHIAVWGDTRVIARCSQGQRPSADITAVRIRSRLSRDRSEYPNEVGLKIIPGQSDGDKLQIRKLTKAGKEFFGIFILSQAFVLWGDDEKSYAELLPGLWKDSDLVYEMDL